MHKKPAIGMIELSSIARGPFVLDAIVKKAEVTLLQGHPVSPGKYICLFSGQVAEVDESMKAGLEAGADCLINSLFLPGADQQLISALLGTVTRGQAQSLLIFETWDVASCLLSADTACKAAQVELFEMHLAKGIGGKGYWVLSGSLEEVQAALEAAESIAGDKLAFSQIIARPHQDMLQFLWPQSH